MQHKNDRIGNVFIGHDQKNNTPYLARIRE